MGSENGVFQQPELHGDHTMKRIYLSLILLCILIAPVLAVTQYNLSNSTFTAIVFNGTAGNMSWTVPTGITSINYTVVAGGGAGGSHQGGGGGAGGVLRGTLSVTPGAIYNITVGDGGTAFIRSTLLDAGNGTNSSINTLVPVINAKGGGGGGRRDAGTGYGKPGGSGGGGGGSAVSQLGGANFTGQGFSGGNGFNAQGGGGGGGYLSNGSNCDSGGNGGTGGTGVGISIVGTFFNISGGGGGFGGTTSALGSYLYGGGNASLINVNGINGTNNSGGGGGGAAYSSADVRGGYGGSGIVILEYSSPVTPLVASFTQSVNPSVVGQAVTYTDTSTGPPTTWNWTLAGTSPTNTTQNAAYKYTLAGAYNIFLNVTNATGSWSNTSQTHTVVNASGMTPQDIWMEAQYLQTFHITDSSTGLPIPIVQIQDTSMQAFTTTNGTGYLTEPFGANVVTFVATGYTSRAVSYVFDSDASHDVQLAASSTSQQNVWYTPWQIRIRIVDFYGAPLPGTNVTASYIAQTLPSTDTSWLITAFGISSQVASDMVNSAKAMEGVTDDNGGLSFTMFKSLEYHLVIANSTSGVASTKNLYPSDQEYVIYVRTAGQTAVNNTLATRNATLPWYSLNSTYISLNMTYQDPSSCTSAITFRVWFRDNSTEVHNATQAVGTALVTDSHIIPKAPIGTEYLWGYNATTVC